MKTATGYEALGIRLGNHVKKFVPEGWREPVCSVSFVPMISADDAQALEALYLSGRTDEIQDYARPNGTMLFSAGATTAMAAAVADFFGQRAEYQRVAAKLNQHIREYVPPDYSEPLRVFMNGISPISPENAETFLGLYEKGILAETLGEYNDAFGRDFGSGRFDLIKPAIEDFFDNGLHEQDLAGESD